MTRLWHKQLFHHMRQQTFQSMYANMQRFADVTKQLIIQGNISRAKKCLQVAEQIWVKGTNSEKNAITNVFIFSVSTFMEMHHCSIRQLFPEKLEEEYIKQINTSGV